MDVIQERLKVTAALAETLVGLTEAEATTKASAQGAKPAVIQLRPPGQPGIYGLTSDLRANRIGLFVQDGVVVRATAG